MTFLERRQRLGDDKSELWLLEISAPSIPEVLRMVNDTQNWVSNGQTYLGCQFGIKPPDDTKGQTPRGQLVIENVGLGITQDLEGMPANEKLRCRLLLTDRANPHAYQRVYRLPLTLVSATTGQVTAALNVDSRMRQQAMRRRATPFTTPGIFP